MSHPDKRINSETEEKETTRGDMAVELCRAFRETTNERLLKLCNRNRDCDWER